MKLIFQREELARVLDVVQRVLPRKSAMPFYQAIYIGVSSKNEVEIRVTNGDQYLRVEVGAKVTDREEGVALPGEEFLRIVRVAPGSEIKITTGAESAQVVSGGADWVLHYLVGVGWSDAPSVSIGKGAVVQGSAVGPEVLREAIRKVQYAVARTQNRPSFQQVMISGGSAVAADGRRAHIISGLEIEGQYLIPETVIDTLLDLLSLVADGAECQIEANEEERIVRFRSPKIEFVTGRLAYEYPDVLGVMVKQGREQEGRLTVNRQALVSAVLVAETAEDEGAVQLVVERGKLRVESESAQMRAKMDFKIAAEGLSGKWQRKFVSQLLTEMLGAFEADEIVFRVSPDDKGMLYVEVEDECSVLMPLTN